MHRDIANARVYIAECLGDAIEIACRSEHFQKSWFGRSLTSLSLCSLPSGYIT